MNADPSKDSFVLSCASKGLTLEDLSDLAPPISLPLREALRQCQLNAQSSWPRRAFALLDRPDQMATATGTSSTRRLEPTNVKPRQRYDHDAACDLSKVMKPVSHPMYQQKRVFKDKATRFSLDRRLADVQRMLTYASPQVVKLPPGVQPTEAELPKAQQDYLELLARRTLALPVAHGMFHYRVTARLRSAGMSIPKVELAAKVLPSTSYMAPSAEALPPEEKTWPYFHSGVATALHVAWTKGDFDASEYAFHRPAELNARHGGFLLGLGLSGQLRSLGTYQAFKYMDPKHEYTSIGLLVGLGAAYIGTADAKVSSALSVHTAALHPPTSAPLNVALSIQAAGLFGIGLLHVATCNRRIADNILRSLSQTHISGVEHPDGCLEAYAISSGFAYGLVILGRGDQYGGPADANILGTFKYLLEGGRGTHLPGAKKNVEGILNAAVTSPAATIALGLTFMRTSRQDVAQLLELPQSLDRLDYVRNDIILLRTTCRHLIMWNDLSSTKASIEALVPTFVSVSLKVIASNAASVPSDQEVVYWHIVAGGCLAVGLKFAGSAKVEAHSLLVEYLDKLNRRASSITWSLRSKLAHQSLQNCVNVICLALASVMAGTGELNVLRRLRVMHGQVKEGMSYGSHMARHMALGLLFLGKGRFTLGTSKIATAALLCAFYPVFPPKSSSNRFHLQALRHMWVLAVEPRCLAAKDVESGNRVYLRLKFKLREGRDPLGNEIITSKYLTAPTLTPPLSSIMSIQADSPRYWSVALDFQSIRSHLVSFIRDQTIYGKRKAGHLSYALDPRGLRSLYTQPETEGATAAYDRGQTTQMLLTKRNELLNLLAAFHSLYPIARANLVTCCLSEIDDLVATQLSAAFTTSVIMESMIQDKAEALSLYRAFAQAFSSSDSSPVKNTEALVFVKRFYQDDIYGRLCKQRRQSLLRREYVDSAYITAEGAAGKLSDDSSCLDRLAHELVALDAGQASLLPRRRDVHFLQTFLQQPPRSVLLDLQKKIVELSGSDNVPPAALQILLPLMVKNVLEKLPLERISISTSEEKLASLLAAILYRISAQPRSQYSNKALSVG
ncbi:hypothetical protein P389DRAFT_153773 [Cystobasidium minutum MCA 4210]|uniref:uncharacterized protein n=1 Tax=Cystobasidium minutum MCA 4210 TaxID=1397322 RepID=UPI0034CD4634|eukprot:jgi/Rhomi1/153773/estExt_Genewise1.C_5_t10245